MILRLSCLTASQSFSILHYSVSGSCTQLGKTIKETLSILPCHAFFYLQSTMQTILVQTHESFQFSVLLETVKPFSFRLTAVPEMEL